MASGLKGDLQKLTDPSDQILSAGVATQTVLVQVLVESAEHARAPGPNSVHNRPP
jgi:hypothetical protein